MTLAETLRLLADKVEEEEKGSGFEWSFTEGEKEILRTLPKKYNWIVRDGESGTITVCEHRPSKSTEFYLWNFNGASYIIPFKQIFRSVRWLNAEPCEFRKYL